MENQLNMTSPINILAIHLQRSPYMKRYFLIIVAGLFMLFPVLAQDDAFVENHYDKNEYRIEMRDVVKLIDVYPDTADNRGLNRREIDLGGYQMMVQVHSSWFPLFDRNPQTFTDIYNCDEDAFHRATHRVYHSPEYPTKLNFFVLDN